jgi:hypothetical protein
MAIDDFRGRAAIVNTCSIAATVHLTSPDIGATSGPALAVDGGMGGLRVRPAKQAPDRGPLIGCISSIAGRGRA